MADEKPGSRWSIGDDKGAADTAARIDYARPEGFTETTEGRLTVLEGPGREIAFFIARANNESADRAMAELDAVLSTLFQDVAAVGTPMRRKFNGMAGTQLKATGTFEGKPVNVTMRFLEVEPGKFVVVAGAYLAARREELKDTFNGFFQSIKPAA
jgi:hypothetical protein